MGQLIALCQCAKAKFVDPCAKRAFQSLNFTAYHLELRCRRYTHHTRLSHRQGAWNMVAESILGDCELRKIPLNVR
jgi:hypothetical protein